MVALRRFIIKSDYFGKLLAFSRLMVAMGKNGGKLRGNKRKAKEISNVMMWGQKTRYKQAEVSVL